MEVKELNYLIALAEEKSISKAAERLYMAQSSLSQFLSTMEANLGYRLFIRQSNGVRPTEAGRIMIRYAYNTISEFHRVQDEMQDITDLKQGKVIFGISGLRGSYLTPPVLNEFRKRSMSISLKKTPWRWNRSSCPEKSTSRCLFFRYLTKGSSPRS